MAVFTAVGIEQLLMSRAVSARLDTAASAEATLFWRLIIILFILELPYEEH